MKPVPHAGPRSEAQLGISGFHRQPWGLGSCTAPDESFQWLEISNSSAAAQWEPSLSALRIHSDGILTVQVYLEGSTSVGGGGGGEHSVIIGSSSSSSSGALPTRQSRCESQLSPCGACLDGFDTARAQWTGEGMTMQATAGPRVVQAGDLIQVGAIPFEWDAPPRGRY